MKNHDHLRFWIVGLLDFGFSIFDWPKVAQEVAFEPLSRGFVML